MTPEKIKEYTELLEKYIKESEALPFSATRIILSLHATTELLELLKSIRYVNIYENPVCDIAMLDRLAIANETKLNLAEITADIVGSDKHEFYSSAIKESKQTALNLFETVGIIKLA
jgi:1,2-phenylacetyl-CoA epoxidase PaaB subunit